MVLDRRSADESRPVTAGEREPPVDLTVLEYSHTPAAAHAGKLLRQLGATVELAPVADRELIPATARAALDAGKRRLGPGEVAERYDVVISDHRCVPGAQRPGPDFPASSILVSILGADNSADPGGHLGGTSLGASAASGVAVAIGRPDQAPLGLPAGVAETVGGTQAVAALLAVYYSGACEAHPADPVQIEVSLNGALELFVGINSKVFDGYPRRWLREGRRTAGSGGPYPAAIFPCQDGFIGIIGRTKENWLGLLEAMGSPEWANDENMRDPYYVGAHKADEADSYLEPWTSSHTERELTELSLKFGFIVAPVRTLPEALQEPQYQLRGFWEEDENGVIGSGLPFVIQTHDGPARVRTSEREKGPAVIDPSRLLAGVRVLDLSWVWAGPMTTMMLADLGAEVIKVEHSSRPDPSRLRGRPSFDGSPVPGPELEVAPYFQQLNHGKLGFGADLRNEGAARVLKELAAKCDVVVENMRPGVLDRRGLGYRDLAAVNPGIVMLSMSLAGQTGPLSRMRGYAPVMSGLAGLESLMAYPPADLVGMYTFSFADANASVYGVAGVVAALLRRRVTGRGCWLDLSQVESTIAAMPLQVSRTLAGQPLDGSPNDDARYLFQDVVLCAGGTGWLVVSAVRSQSYRALAGVLGYPAGGGDEQADRDELRDALRVWAQVRDRDAAESELRTAGVNAIGVRQWDEVVAVRRERGPVQTVEIPHPFGRRPSIYVPPWRVDGKLPAATLRAPFLGEHTEQVLREMQLRDQPGVDELLRAGLLLQHHPNEEAG